ncbi:MAG: hypothetical protein ACKOCM_04435 [Cyanobacteriota bacterium]
MNKSLITIKTDRLDRDTGSRRNLTDTQTRDQRIDGTISLHRDG